MAKKTTDPSVMEFEFRAADLERLLADKPKKVLITMWVEVIKTDKGEKMGALRVKASTELTAKSAAKKSLAKMAVGDPVVYGEPKPPGIG